MKGIVRIYLFYLLAFWLMASLLQSFVIKDFPHTLFLAAAVGSVMQMVVKPLLTLVLFPISFLTGGLFNILTNGLIILTVVTTIPQIRLENWYFAGATMGGQQLPPILFTPLITVVSGAAFLTMLKFLFDWLVG